MRKLILQSISALSVAAATAANAYSDFDDAAVTPTNPFAPIVLETAVTQPTNADPGSLPFEIQYWTEPYVPELINDPAAETGELLLAGDFEVGLSATTDFQGNTSATGSLVWKF